MMYDKIRIAKSGLSSTFNDDLFVYYCSYAFNVYPFCEKNIRLRGYAPDIDGNICLHAKIYRAKITHEIRFITILIYGTSALPL